jgi:hypothetical protein
LATLATITTARTRNRRPPLQALRRQGEGVNFFEKISTRPCLWPGGMLKYFQFFNQCSAGDRRRVQWRHRKVSPLMFLEMANVDVLC